MKKRSSRRNAAFQEILDEQKNLCRRGCGKNVSEIQLEEANIRQKTEFAIEKLERIQREAERFAEEDRKSKSGCRLFRRGCEEKTGRY